MKPLAIIQSFLNMYMILMSLTSLRILRTAIAFLMPVVVGPSSKNGRHHDWKTLSQASIKSNWFSLSRKYFQPRMRSRTIISTTQAKQKRFSQNSSMADAACSGDSSGRLTSVSTPMKIALRQTMEATQIWKYLLLSRVVSSRSSSPLKLTPFDLSTASHSSCDTEERPKPLFAKRAVRPVLCSSSFSCSFSSASSSSMPCIPSR
mmetsp:Transcript_26508/g.56163  ORF Transcript_26508/g.56163 Transcript_26508/m.56163 type:complete len:205 (+) Transcript_26508:115-729(+)